MEYVRMAGLTMYRNASTYDIRVDEVDNFLKKIHNILADISISSEESFCRIRDLLEKNKPKPVSVEEISKYIEQNQQWTGTAFDLLKRIRDNGVKL